MKRSEIQSATLGMQGGDTLFRFEIQRRLNLK